MTLIVNNDKLYSAQLIVTRPVAHFSYTVSISRSPWPCMMLQVLAWWRNYHSVHSQIPALGGWASCTLVHLQRQSAHINRPPRRRSWDIQPIRLVLSILVLRVMVLHSEDPSLCVVRTKSEQKRENYICLKVSNDINVILKIVSSSTFLVVARYT